MYRGFFLVLNLCLLFAVQSGTISVAPIELPEQSMGNPASEATILSAVYTKMSNGQLVAVTIATGINGRLNITDLNSGRNIWNGPAVEDGLEVYSRNGFKLRNGKIIFTLGRTDVILEFDPESRSRRIIHNPYHGVGGSAVFLDATQDDSDVIYMGSSSLGGADASLVSYDPSSGAWRDYGTIESGSRYSGGLATEGGNVYIGMGSGPGRAVIWSVDTATGAKSRLPAPNFSPGRGSIMVTSLSAVNGKLFARWSDEDQIRIFDLSKRLWVTALTGATGDVVANPYSPREALVYQHGAIIIYDTIYGKSFPLVEGKSTMGQAGLLTDSSAVGPNSVVTFNASGNFTRITRGRGAWSLSTDQSNASIAGAPRVISRVESLGDSVVATPGFVGSQLWQANPVHSGNLELRTITPRQIQTVSRASNGRIQIASYAPNEVISLDGEFKDHRPPVSLGPFLTRPIDSVSFSASRTAVVGEAGYGRVGGSLSVFDNERNAIVYSVRSGTELENQVPRSLAALEGQLFIGLEASSEANSPGAHVMKTDGNSGRVLGTFLIGGNGGGPVASLAAVQGKLWAGVGHELVEIDPAEMGILRRIDVRRHCGGRQDSRGLKVSSIGGMGQGRVVYEYGGSICSFDAIRPDRHWLMARGTSPAFSAQGQLYYLRGNEIFLKDVNGLR